MLEKLEPSDLRPRMGIRYADLDPILEELAKEGRIQTTWTPERLGNYVFADTLVRNVMNDISPSYLPSILYDKGRLSPAQTKNFEDYISNKDSYFEKIGIKSYKGQIPTPVEQSSHMEPGIWAADIVAGSFECKYKHNEPWYSDLLTLLSNFSTEL
jgi:hypothetical protein